VVDASITNWPYASFTSVQQRRAHALAEERRGDDVGHVHACERGDREADHNMHLVRPRQPARADASDIQGCGNRIFAAAGHVAKGPLRRGEDLVGLDIAGNADDHVGPGVLLPDPRDQVIAREAADVRAAADHRAGRRMRAVAGYVEELERGRHSVVFVLRVLVEEDVTLARELGFWKGALAYDVAEHADEGRRVLGEPMHVEGGVIPVGVGVDRGAQPLGIEVDALAVARMRALESHVLDEMADPVQRRAFVLAAAAHEDAHLGGRQMRQADNDDAYAVAERRDHGVRIFRVGAEGRHATIQWMEDVVTQGEGLGVERIGHPTTVRSRRSGLAISPKTHCDASSAIGFAMSACIKRGHGPEKGLSFQASTGR
jgi:hypothetical protein